MSSCSTKGDTKVSLLVRSVGSESVTPDDVIRVKRSNVMLAVELYFLLFMFAHLFVCIFHISAIFFLILLNIFVSFFMFDLTFLIFSSWSVYCYFPKHIGNICM